MKRPRLHVLVCSLLQKYAGPVTTALYLPSLGEIYEAVPAVEHFAGPVDIGNLNLQRGAYVPIADRPLPSDPERQ